MDLQVFVAAHKPYQFPDDPAYLPVQVGRALSEADLGITGDDTGDNISGRNQTYCELTGLYWAWRNTSHEAYGLAHYRRYFAGQAGIASGDELASWLDQADVVVPNKRHYVIETVGKHYAHAHHASDLDAARAVLEEAHPDYLPSFDAVLAARSLSLYNMFAMRRQHLDEYCQWLFPVLEEVWTRIPWDSYGPTQQRAIGYLGERLFNVWLRQRADLRVTHRPIHNTEREPVISKGVKMVGRKLGVGKAD